jgi:hypothetical protein
VALAAALEVEPTDLLGADTMEAVSAHVFREVLKIVEEAKRLNPEATEAVLTEVSDGDN